MAEYLIEESGDEEVGFVWNVMIRDGSRVKCIAQCLDEKFADRFILAQIHADAMEGGMISLGLVKPAEKKKRRARELVLDLRTVMEEPPPK